MTPTQAAAERLDINELERNEPGTPELTSHWVYGEYDLRDVNGEIRARGLGGKLATFVVCAADHWPAIIAALREGERLREENERLKAELKQFYPGLGRTLQNPSVGKAVDQEGSSE